MLGDVEAAQAALEAGAGVNHANAHGMTPLLVCCGGLGPPRLVELLISAGADVNQADTSSWSPLIYVASSGQLPLLELLLRAGADVHAAAERDRGWSALTRAAYRGHASVVHRLLTAGAQPGWETEGRTAAQWAAAGPHAEVEAVLGEWGRGRGGAMVGLSLCGEGSKDDEAGRRSGGGACASLSSTSSTGRAAQFAQSAEFAVDMGAGSSSSGGVGVSHMLA